MDDDLKCPECGKNSIKTRKIKKKYNINGRNITAIVEVKYCSNCNTDLNISNLNQHGLFASGVLRSTIIDLV